MIGSAWVECRLIPGLKEGWVAHTKVKLLRLPHSRTVWARHSLLDGVSDLVCCVDHSCVLEVASWLYLHHLAHHSQRASTQAAARIQVGPVKCYLYKNWHIFIQGQHPFASNCILFRSSKYVHCLVLLETRSPMVCSHSCCCEYRAGARRRGGALDERRSIAGRHHVGQFTQVSAQ